MSEMRDLQEDINYLKTRDYHNEPSVQIGFHAIDRAIAAEKERDELRKRVEELENQLIGIQVVVDFGIGIGTSDAIKGALQSVKRTVESLFDKQEDTP